MRLLFFSSVVLRASAHSMLALPALRGVAASASSAFGQLHGALRTMKKRSKNMQYTRNGPSWGKGTIKDWSRRWWQPVLPALAAPVAAGIVPGAEDSSSRQRKRALKKQQQIISMHARRIEGVKRNAAIREQKRAAEQGRVRDVLREYADMLRGSAVAGKGDPPPAPPTPP